jgi:lipopolysaccharide/colanic/teichoic acid biosynthesis glycosyltransferase
MNEFAVHQVHRADRGRSPLSRKRVQLAGAIFFAAIVPWFIRGVVVGDFAQASGWNALSGNIVAIVIVFWTRYSVEIYPGIRRAYVILPTALTAHAIVVTWYMLTRFPYDRVALIAGFLAHVVWLYFVHFYGEGRIQRRIAVVPFGSVERIFDIDGIRWVRLLNPILDETCHCDAIVADFSADLPDQWEAFLAEAALAGRIVYQHKQLSESITGRVELERLSENSFGSLVPARGYFYLKTVIDFVAAVAVLPLVLPAMAVIAFVIRVDSSGPALFRQSRVGHAGKNIVVYKFRTMRAVVVEDERRAAMTADDDARVTRIGHILRKLRIDEIPQIFNILKGEMSWIGPRPEAAVLSTWYTSELPFYRYRHVVKPGISGWAQVNQGHVAEIDEVHRKLQYDFYYIKYFSPWLDAVILFRTIKIMLTGYGAK